MALCYIWRDPKTNVERYVGWGSSESRPYKHITRSCNKRLMNMLQKRITEGFELEPEIIRDLTEDEAKTMEIELIAKYGREDKGLGTLFNATDGGDGGRGYICSDESRIKLSEAGKKYEKTEEHRQNLSKAGQGNSALGINSWITRRARYGYSGRPNKEGEVS